MSDARTGGADLVELLEAEARRQGFALDRLHPDGPAGAFARAGRGRLTVRREAEEDGGAYRVSLRAPGIDLGQGATPELAALARTVRIWQDGAPLTDLEAPLAWLRLLPTAVAHEEGRAVEATWDAMRRRVPGIRTGDRDVIEAAYAQPRLRVLYPHPSHGCLAFFRSTRFPWRADTPFMAGTHVYAPGHRLLGIGETLEEAAEMVVAHLPEGCGPAVEGLWPGVVDPLV